jgi:hypothetical protein
MVNYYKVPINILYRNVILGNYEIPQFGYFHFITE